MASLDLVNYDYYKCRSIYFKLKKKNNKTLEHHYYYHHFNLLSFKSQNRASKIKNKVYIKST